jgi:hypothetical protein
MILLIKIIPSDLDLLCLTINGRKIIKGFPMQLTESKKPFNIALKG